MRAWMLLGLVACTGEPTTDGTGTSPTDSDAVVDDLIGILVQPERLVLPEGGTAQLKATGLRADRTTIDLTAVVDWSVAPGAVASVSNALDAEGQVEALSLGAATVTASTQGVTSAVAELSVTDAELLGLVVEPDTVALAVGQTTQLTARAAFSDGVTSDATGSVRWITQDPSVAVLDGDGGLEAVGLGSTSVVARWDGITSPPLTVDVSASASPDLVVQELHAVAVGGDRVDVSVAVHNQGTAGTSNVWVDLVQDPSGTPSVGDYGADWDEVGWLGPGQTAWLSFDRPVASGADEVVFWAIVDTEDLVAESNEANNTASTSLDLAGTSSLAADLVVYDVDWVADSEAMVVEIEVANLGDVAAGGFYVDLFADLPSAPGPGQTSATDAYVGSLAPWSTTTVSIYADHTCWGTCSAWVRVDSTETVVEADEGNNTAGPYSVAVGSPSVDTGLDTGWDSGWW